VCSCCDTHPVAKYTCISISDYLIFAIFAQSVNAPFNYSLFIWHNNLFQKHVTGCLGAFRDSLTVPCVSGVDVMITIFCDFCHFSAIKLAVFSKNNVMIKLLHNLALF
jgi:hypothetical protein